MFCKWFEPRSISSLSSVIVWVSVVLKRTVVVIVNNNSSVKCDLLGSSVVLKRTVVVDNG